MVRPKTPYTNQLGQWNAERGCETTQKTQTGVWVDEQGGDNTLVKYPQWETVFPIAMMHEQAVQNTSLYKRHAELTTVKHKSKVYHGQVAE